MSLDAFLASVGSPLASGGDRDGPTKTLPADAVLKLLDARIEAAQPEPEAPQATREVSPDVIAALQDHARALGQYTRASLAVMLTERLAPAIKAVNEAYDATRNADIATAAKAAAAAGPALQSVGIVADFMAGDIQVYSDLSGGAAFGALVERCDAFGDALRQRIQQVWEDALVVTTREDTVTLTAGNPEDLAYVWRTSVDRDAHIKTLAERVLAIPDGTVVTDGTELVLARSDEPSLPAVLAWMRTNVFLMASGSPPASGVSPDMQVAFSRYFVGKYVAHEKQRIKKVLVPAGCSVAELEETAEVARDEARSIHTVLVRNGYVRAAAKSAPSVSVAGWSAAEPRSDLDEWAEHLGLSLGKDVTGENLERVRAVIMRRDEAAWDTVYMNGIEVPGEEPEIVPAAEIPAPVSADPLPELEQPQETPALQEQPREPAPKTVRTKHKLGGVKVGAELSAQVSASAPEPMQEDAWGIDDWGWGGTQEQARDVGESESAVGTGVPQHTLQEPLQGPREYQADLHPQPELLPREHTTEPQAEDAWDFSDDAWDLKDDAWDAADDKVDELDRAHELGAAIADPTFSAQDPQAPDVATILPTTEHAGAHAEPSQTGTAPAETAEHAPDAQEDAWGLEDTDGFDVSLDTPLADSLQAPDTVGDGGVSDAAFEESAPDDAWAEEPQAADWDDQPEESDAWPEAEPAKDEHEDRDWNDELQADDWNDEPEEIDEWPTETFHAPDASTAPDVAAETEHQIQGDAIGEAHIGSHTTENAQDPTAHDERELDAWDQAYQYPAQETDVQPAIDPWDGETNVNEPDPWDPQHWDEQLQGEDPERTKEQAPDEACEKLEHDDRYAQPLHDVDTWDTAVPADASEQPEQAPGRSEHAHEHVDETWDQDEHDTWAVDAEGAREQQMEQPDALEQPEEHGAWEQQLEQDDPWEQMEQPDAWDQTEHEAWEQEQPNTVDPQPGQSETWAQMEQPDAWEQPEQTDAWDQFEHDVWHHESELDSGLWTGGQEQDTKALDGLHKQNTVTNNHTATDDLATWDAEAAYPNEHDKYDMKAARDAPLDAVAEVQDRVVTEATDPVDPWDNWDDPELTEPTQPASEQPSIAPEHTQAAAPIPSTAAEPSTQESADHDAWGLDEWNDTADDAWNWDETAEEDPWETGVGRSGGQAEGLAVSQRAAAVAYEMQVMADAHAEAKEHQSAIGAAVAHAHAHSIAESSQLFRALMPQAHYKTLEHVPALCMLFANDCTYLAHVVRSFVELNSALEQEAEALGALGVRWFRAQLSIQVGVLRESLHEADGFTRADNDAQYARQERAIQQVLHVLRHLGSVWAPIVPPRTLLRTLGELVDAVFAQVLEMVQALDDIGERESERVAALCRLLSQGVEQSLPGSVESTIGVSAAAVVPTWFKFMYLPEILTASLRDLEYLLFDPDSGGALEDYSKGEIVALVRALFADTPHRRRLLDRIG